MITQIKDLKSEHTHISLQEGTQPLFWHYQNAHLVVIMKQHNKVPTSHKYTGIQ